ncbi:MAG: hypothetical protein ABR874_00895 [Candidatus Sulfotelmatobacter sp.]|jgi:uncharacterized membrane protein
MPETADVCPACGRAMEAVESAHGKVGGLPENIAGALAYFTSVPAIFFLLVNPYRSNRFVRFHAYQCIGLSLAAVIVAGVLRIGGIVVAFIPMLGPLIVVLLWVIAILGFFILWLVVIVKALQGEMFKLPVFGDIAERQMQPQRAN